MEWRKLTQMFDGVGGNTPYNAKIISVTLGALVFLCFLSMIVGAMWGKGSEAFMGALAFSALYFITGFNIVNGDRERAGIVLLGYVLRHTVDSGVIFVPQPYPLFRLERVPRNVIQKELPDEPENVWGHVVDENGHEVPIPLDQVGRYKKPIRVTFQDSDPEVKDDPLKKGGYPFQDPHTKGGEKDPAQRRLTVKVTPVLRFRIVDVIRFLKTFVNAESAKQHLEDMVITETTTALQTGTYARGLSNIEGLGMYISDKLIERLYQSTGFDRVKLTAEQWEEHRKMVVKTNPEVLLENIPGLRENSEDPGGKIIPNAVLEDVDCFPLLKKKVQLLSIAVANFWGVLILPVQVKAFGASHAFNASVQEIGRSRAEGQSGIEKAVGISAIAQAEIEGALKGLGFDKDTLTPEQSAQVINLLVSKNLIDGNPNISITSFGSGDTDLFNFGAKAGASFGAGQQASQPTGKGGSTS